MVVLLWFSVACFGVRVSVMFHQISFSSVLVAEFDFWERAVHSVNHTLSLYFDYLQL